MIPDYVTTFECWSNQPLEVGQIEPLSGMNVVEILTPLPGEVAGVTRFIGRDLTPTWPPSRRWLSPSGS